MNLFITYVLAVSPSTSLAMSKFHSRHSHRKFRFQPFFCFVFDVSCLLNLPSYNIALVSCYSYYVLVDFARYSLLRGSCIAFLAIVFAVNWLAFTIFHYDHHYHQHRRRRYFYRIASLLSCHMALYDIKVYVYKNRDMISYSSAKWLADYYCVLAYVFRHKVLVFLWIFCSKRRPWNNVDKVEAEFF